MSVLFRGVTGAGVTDDDDLVSLTVEKVKEVFACI